VSAALSVRGVTLRRGSSAVIVTSLFVALSLAKPSLASAFQNPETFVADPTQGGGGGRFFTGSPLDSYTCEVCHRSETTLPVGIFGLPLGSYQGGATYRVTIDWPDDLMRVALTMEATDRQGRAAGTWSAPDAATLSAPDLCTLAVDSPTGTTIIPVDGSRAIVSAIDCGQHQTTMNWTAPASIDPLAAIPLPDVLFSGAIVASNTNGKLAGDSAARFARNLAAPGAEEPAVSNVLARCSVTTIRNAEPPLPITIFALACSAVLGVRRRARSRR
jgi:hypothetical protein